MSVTQQAPAETSIIQEEVLQESEATKGINILDYWYPVCFTKNFPEGRAMPVQLFNEPLVIFRGKSGQFVCLQDRCAHRSAPLSIGAWKDGVVECRYHGWQFGEEGKCVRIPSLASPAEIPKSVKVPSYPATEREGMIWVWPGDPTKCSLNTGFPQEAPELKEAGWKILDEPYDQDYSYWAVIENLLDPSHLQFAHEGQQGKNIGSTNDTFTELNDYDVTDVPNIKGGFQGIIRTTKTIKPLNFRIVFDPPITVRLEVWFPNGWKFNQMHYLIPIGEGKTRMLLRSLRNWLKFLPDSMFKSSNLRILNQDTYVLYAQKLRLDQGASRWNYPVKGDALAIRYRRWRDVVEPRSKPWFKGYVGSSFKKGGGVKRDVLAAEKEIEDVPNCCGACDNNLPLLNEINAKAPELWPSSKQFKEPLAPSHILSTIWNVIFYGGYLFSVIAAIYLLATK
jgi:phenylpropionate dioxygenase-like ring-hydroxylating dioxygenase large terminal subunit